jgi:hypothetical protein
VPSSATEVDIGVTWKLVGVGKSTSLMLRWLSTQGVRASTSDALAVFEIAINGKRRYSELYGVQYW